MESIDWDIYAKSYDDTQHLLGRPDLAQKHYEMIGKDQGRDAGFDAVLVYCSQPEVESIYQAKSYYLQSSIPCVIRSRKTLIQAVKANQELSGMLPDVSDYLVEPAVDSALFQLHLQQQKVSVDELIAKIIQEITNELLSETVNAPVMVAEGSNTQFALPSRARAGVVKVKQKAPCLIDVDCLIPVLDGKAYLVSGYCFDPEKQLSSIKVQAGAEAINIFLALRSVVRQDCYENLLSRGVPSDLLDQDVGFAVLVPSDSFERPPEKIVCEFISGESSEFNPSVVDLKGVSGATLQAIWRALFTEFFAYFSTDIDELDDDILVAVMEQEKPIGYGFEINIQEIAVVERSTFLRLVVNDPDARLKSLYLRTPTGRHIYLSDRLVMQLESSNKEFVAFLENLYLAPNTGITIHALLEDGQWCRCHQLVSLSTTEKVREFLFRFWNLKLIEHSRQVLEKLIEPAYATLFSKKAASSKAVLQELNFGKPPVSPRVTFVVNLRFGFHTVRNLMGMLAGSHRAGLIELLFVVDRTEQVSQAEQLFKNLYSIYKLPCTVLASLEIMNSAELVTRASKRALGDTLVFMAGNVVPSNIDSIFRLADYSSLNPKCVVGPVVLNSDDSIDECGLVFVNDSQSGHFWLHDSPWRGFSMSMLNLSNPIEVPAVSASCFSIGKNFFLGLNGFDSNYAIDGFEDIDFSLKVWASGYEVKVLPELSVYRLGSQNSVQPLDQGLDLKIKLINSKQLNKKWGSLIQRNFGHWDHGISRVTSGVELRETIQSLVG